MSSGFDLAPAVNSDLLQQASGISAGESGAVIQQVKTSYTTAVMVQQARNLEQVRVKLMAESRMAGESFYYGWGSGKDKIEGPSVGLAMAAARSFGNCAVDMQPMQETPEAWIMTAVFVDLETGFTLTRQFRQSKKSVVHGKHDAERKNDIRFQIGQSKSVRNVVANALPKWLIEAAVTEAKNGVKEKINSYIKANGIVAAVNYVLRGLLKHGVKDEHVLKKCEVASVEGLTVDHVVLLRGDLHALDNGQDYATALFPLMADSGSKKAKTSDINKLLDKEPAKKTKKQEVTQQEIRDATPEPEKEKSLLQWNADIEGCKSVSKLLDMQVETKNPIVVDTINKRIAEVKAKMSGK